MLTDLLKWGGKRADPSGRGAATPPRPRRAGRRVEGPPEVPRRPGAAADSPVLLDLGPVDRHQRRVLRRASRLQAVHRGHLRRRRSATRAGTLRRARGRPRRRASRTPTASIDGMLCWDCFDFLDKASAQALARADRPHAAAWRRGAWALLHHQRARAAASRSTRSSTSRACATATHAGRRRHASRPAEPRHHPDVRRPDRRRLVPAQEQHPRDAAAPDLISPATRLGSCCVHGPAHRSPERFRHS